MRGVGAGQGEQLVELVLGQIGIASDLGHLDIESQVFEFGRTDLDEQRRDGHDSCLEIDKALFDQVAAGEVGKGEVHHDFKFSATAPARGGNLLDSV